LGVGRDADETQIKKAFRSLARELHPDVNTDDPQAEDKFKELAEAYEILSDADRRATYDRYGFEGLRSGGYQQPNFDQFGSISDLFEAFFGGGGGAGGGGIFGGTRGPAPGADILAELRIDLAQAAAGGQFEVTYEAVGRCEHCKGNGAEPGTPIETCTRCGGAGQLQSVVRTPFGQMMRATVCDTCGGDGRVATVPCKECRGRGRVAATQTVSVDIPAGIADGQRVRIRGRGHAGEVGGGMGNLYVHVSVAEHERLMRDGDDLITVLDLPAPLAALGTTAEVTTLDGPAEVVVEPGVQPGERVVLKGKGMPRLRHRGRGDLQVIVNVKVPRHLSAEQRSMLEEFNSTLTEENLREDESMIAKLRRAFRSHAA
jgi:molecular chaperone DnaJ